MVQRAVTTFLADSLFKQKAVLLFGPRQVGKTTLVRTIVEQIGVPFQWFSGDEPDIRQALSNVTSTRLKSLFGAEKLVVIDEAQRVENIGLTLKLATDNFPDVQVVATGSSAFELANQINEPLTGRKFEFYLYPFSFGELSQHNGLLVEKRLLENRLIFGAYPEVINQPGRERETLNLLADSYLYKDLFALEGLKRSSLFGKLLSALALQVGSEVSYTELARLVGADKNTVERYIDLLEQAFVVFRLPGFSRNLRTELRKAKKIYFYDNGIRNAILGNFQPLSGRTDVGALWENYLMAERLKLFHYSGLYGGRYFWRTTQQQEIDYLEDRDGQLRGYEFKWNPTATVRFPKPFLETYPGSLTSVVTPDNYETFLTDY